jgi:hypothetical protein
LSLVGLVVGLFIGGSNWQPIAPGLPDAGPALTWFGQIAKLIFTGLGVIIFGRLVSITFLTRPDSLTKSLSRISVLANLWAVVAILTAIAQMSYVLGLNYQQIFSSGVISTYIFDLTSSRGYVISAVIAIAIAVIAIFVRNENTLFLLVVLTGAAIANGTTSHKLLISSNTVNTYVNSSTRPILVSNLSTYYAVYVAKFGTDGGYKWLKWVDSTDSLEVTKTGGFGIDVRNNNVYIAGIINSITNEGKVLINSGINDTIVTSSKRPILGDGSFILKMGT